MPLLPTPDIWILSLVDGSIRIAAIDGDNDKDNDNDKDKDKDKDRPHPLGLDRQGYQPLFG
jgi:hypothetical protein